MWEDNMTKEKIKALEEKIVNVKSQLFDYGLVMRHFTNTLNQLQEEHKQVSSKIVEEEKVKGLKKEKVKKSTNPTQ